MLRRPAAVSTAKSRSVRRLGRIRMELKRDEDTERPGLFGLDWKGGHAITGEVLRTDGDAVTRRLRG